MIPLLAAAAPCVLAPATEPVMVEFVQSGTPEAGFRLLPDGRWQELDAAWRDRVTFDPERLALARSLVLAASAADLTPPTGVVSDATGCSRWRLGARVVEVREGTTMPVLSGLYAGLRALVPITPASSRWVVDGTPHEVTCSVTQVPDLSAAARIWTTAARDAGPWPTGAATLLDVTWRESGEAVGRTVISTDGRVGAEEGGQLTQTRRLTAAQLDALRLALRSVDWAGACG